MAKNNNQSTGNKGYASMNEEKQKKISNKGDSSQGQQSNSSNFSNEHKKASQEGGKRSGNQ